MSDRSTISPAETGLLRGGARVGGWAWVIAFAVGVTLVRIAYQVWLCPYNLIEDEAHYWEWSRRLGWSYYSKGPGVAWAIWLATRLSQEEWAVRLPAVMAGGFATVFVAGMAGDVFRSARARLFAAFAFNLAPIFQATTLLMTIDMPYVACWAAASWAAWRAMMERSRWAWVALGLALAVGFLFKYTIVLLVPGLIGFALFRRAEMRAAEGWRWWLAACVAAALLGLAPVVAWNAQEGWPTVQHLLGHLGVRGGDMPAEQAARERYSPLWTLEFVGVQFLLIGLVGGVVACALRLSGRDEETRRGRAFMLWCALPLMVFYVLVTFAAQAEGNWAVASFVSLCALAGWGASEGLAQRDAHTRVWWKWAVGVGIVAGLGMMRVDLLAGLPGIGKYVPLGRFAGADLQAANAMAIAQGLRERTGKEPFFVAQHYGVASRLAYYLPGRPTVYCSSSRMSGRKTQYDLWRETDLDDPALRGRPAVAVGAMVEQWRSAFETVTDVGRLEGDTKRNRPAYACEGYRGFK